MSLIKCKCLAIHMSNHPNHLYIQLMEICSVIAHFYMYMHYFDHISLHNSLRIIYPAMICSRSVHVQNSDLDILDHNIIYI